MSFDESPIIVYAKEPIQYVYRPNTYLAGRDYDVSGEVVEYYDKELKKVPDSVQKQLEAIDKKYPPLPVGFTPEQWLDRAYKVVMELLLLKIKELDEHKARYAGKQSRIGQVHKEYGAYVLGKQVSDLQGRMEKLNAEITRRQALARQPVFNSVSNYSMSVSSMPAVSVAGRGVAQVIAGAASLAQSITDAVASLGRILAAGPGVYVATFATLMLYSSRTVENSKDQTPDSVRYGLGVDATKLGLSANAALQPGKTVDMPMRLVNSAKGKMSAIGVVKTDGVKVPKAVPVRAATLNTITGMYQVTVPSTIPNEPPVTLNWLPIAKPLNPTSTTPVVTPSVPVYDGSQLTPVKPEARPYPGLVTLPSDYIIVFPVGSGVSPVYVMFKDPLDSGIFTRTQLQRKFNSHANDFGLGGLNSNTENLTKFRDAILAHLSDKKTVEKGIYRREKGSKVYFNPETNKVVILKGDGMFLSGWQLEPGSNQYEHYMKTEVL